MELRRSNETETGSGSRRREVAGGGDGGSGKRVETRMETFAEVDGRMRDEGASGTVRIRSLDGGEEGVFVYLRGWVVYAVYDDHERCGDEAIDAVPDRETFEVQAKRGDDEKPKMVRTYMRYVGREERLIDVHGMHAEVDARTVVVTEVGNLEKTELPGGERLGYSPDEEGLRRLFGKTGDDGYGLSNDSVVFFENGGVTERKKLKENDDPVLVDGDVRGLGCRYLDVSETGRGDGVYRVGIDGWEVVRTDEEGGGFLGLF